MSFAFDDEELGERFSSIELSVERLTESLARLEGRLAKLAELVLVRRALCELAETLKGKP